MIVAWRGLELYVVLSRSGSRSYLAQPAGAIMSLQEEIYEEMEEDLSDILPNSWEWLNSTLGHLNSILFTVFFVLAIVVAYIVYIIHLYDAGKLGGTPNSKPPPRRKKQTAAEKIAEERWNKKFM